MSKNKCYLILLLFIIIGSFSDKNITKAYTGDNIPPISYPTPFNIQTFTAFDNNLFSYKSYLEYPSLGPTKNFLKSLSFTKKSGGTISGYDLVLQVGPSYSANGTNQEKENFFATSFANINFPSSDHEQYIIRVIHALWMEKYGNLPWSLKNYSQDQIALLFWIANLQPGLPPLVNISPFFVEKLAKEKLRLEGAYKVYKLAKKFQKNTIVDTVVETIRWQKKNFFHAYWDWGWDVYKDNQSEADKVNGNYAPASLNRLFEERVTGCHENSELLQDFLRSLNIPAININYAGHGLVYIPTLNKYVHGDHIADFHLIPATEYLLDSSDLSSDPAGYNNVMYNKYPDAKDFFTNTWLFRSNNNLYLEDLTIKGPISQTDLNIMKAEVPEFNLQYSGYSLTSDLVPIQTLDALSS